MAKNILITGAAGFIGGSVLASFVTRESGPIKDANLFAAVRSAEQVQSLSKLGVKTLQLDLSDGKAVKDAVVSNEIDIVVHTASAIDTNIVSALIDGLGLRREATGKATYFIHTSITAVFSAEGGWPYGEVKDTDPIFEKEKELGDANPARKVTLLVTEASKARGVTSFILPVPQVYGRGTGEWRKLSVAIPAHVRTSIQHKSVHKFDVEGKPHAVHISDLAEFYALLVERVLLDEDIPSGEEGYYFTTVHGTQWWAIMQKLAEGLHKRGLVAEPKVEIWPSDDVAAEWLGFPRAHIRAIGVSSGDIVTVKAYEKLGWQPKWDEKMFMESLDDEVQDCLDLDTVGSSLFDAFKTSK
ncbi:hypothetical protein BDV96DRAFT_611553 [Lophiotrema nucula]|uniref:NAD-dependent epimerase/dehydratase domain-containing protein n=1 Tax=Lophiotrema nucula TaxID=690887 RepID=A0A6A5ZHV3_9PLEO|nr:hypothetical protein BDV96DRAFT_611553 [Lophiotrema nucula]